MHDQLLRRVRHYNGTEKLNGGYMAGSLVRMSAENQEMKLTTKRKV
jgi:hypothetical protein